MITHIELVNKDGAAHTMANNEPMCWEFECEIGYDIDPGQKTIINPSDRCQPGYPPSVEEIHLESAKILFGSCDYVLGKDSRWWPVIEEKLNADDFLKDGIFQHEADLAEDGRF